MINFTQARIYLDLRNTGSNYSEKITIKNVLTKIMKKEIILNFVTRKNNPQKKTLFVSFL